MSPAAGAAPPVVAETEPNDTSATGNVIDLSIGRALATGAIVVSGDVDYWKITVPANARIWAFADTGGPQTDVRDTVLTLFDTNGTTILETDDNDGTGNGGDIGVESELASVIAGRQVGAGGTYFLQVKDSDIETMSRYELTVVVASTATLESEPNGSMGSATPLVTSASPIAARNAAIGDTNDEDFNDDDLDYYSIAATVGDVIFVSADGDPNRDGVQTDVAFDILDATGRLILTVAGHEDGPGGTGVGFIGEGATLKVATSPVYVRVRGDSSLSEGSYRIMAASHAFPSPPSSFYTVQPCRIADTRTGYPGRMISGVSEWFEVGGRCGIPWTAVAVVFNFTVVSPTASGTVTVWAGNQPPPTTHVLGFPAGASRASNAIIGLATDGYADILVEGTLTLGATFDFVIDVTGYFDGI